MVLRFQQQITTQGSAGVSPAVGRASSPAPIGSARGLRLRVQLRVNFQSSSIPGVPRWPVPISCQLSDYLKAHGSIQRVCPWVQAGRDTAPHQVTKALRPRRRRCTRTAPSATHQAAPGCLHNEMPMQSVSQSCARTNLASGWSTFLSAIMNRRATEIWSSESRIEAASTRMRMCASRRWRSAISSHG